MIQFKEIPKLVLRELPMTEGVFSMNLDIGKSTVFQKVTSDDNYRKEILHLLQAKNVNDEIQLVVYNDRKSKSFNLMVSHLKEKLPAKFNLEDIK
jgi:hypothetical protein